MRYSLLLGLLCPLYGFCQANLGHPADLAPGDPTRWQELSTEELGIPSPSELVSFEAASSGRDGIRIKWTTLGAGIQERYVVERSTDRLHWETITVIRGHAGGSKPSHYAVDDPTPPEGVLHYRLGLELDGTLLEWSDEFTVNHEAPRGLLIHGDARPGHFVVSAPGSLSEVMVLNNRGTFLPMQVEYIDGVARVNAEILQSGTYYVQATVDGKPMLRPVIVDGALIVGG